MENKLALPFFSCRFGDKRNGALYEEKGTDVNRFLFRCPVKPGKTICD